MTHKTVWITYLRKQNSEVFYFEGPYDRNFIDLSLKPMKAIWKPEKKRWWIQKEHLNAIKYEAQRAFDSVMYGEGGDFVDLNK